MVRGPWKEVDSLSQWLGLSKLDIWRSPIDNPTLSLPSPHSLSSHLNRRGLQQGDLVLPAELEEARELFGKVNNLLHRHDGQLGKVGKALLAGFPALRVRCTGPRLPRVGKEERGKLL